MIKITGRREMMISLPELEEAVFLERKNRFVGMVELAGQISPAHVPSSGRMTELLYPGNTVYVAPMPHGKRTRYRIHLAHYGETLVSVDSLLPNRLMYKVLSRQVLKHFIGYQEIKKEVSYGESRFDLCMEGDAGKCFIEVKSVTLVEGGTAMFPDAPSQRGVKHLQELIRAVGEGYRVAVIFVVQRNDARVFSPNRTTDPLFSQTLSRAASAGVEIYALDCHVSKQTVGLRGNMPVKL